MKRFLSLLLITFFATAALAAPPPIPKTPAAIKGLLYAQAFELDDEFQFYWRAEKPKVSSGYLLVIEVNPDLVYPRQIAEPVLYVGDQTAMRLNVGYKSGRVIAIVPGNQNLAKSSVDNPEKTEMRIWFGTPRLPEQVTANIIQQERQLASDNGVGQLSVADVKKALQLGGQKLKAGNFNGLLGNVAKLIINYSEDERELADILANQGK
ncbi:TPA: hypothetical protein EYP66_15830 [Candidatus Poribacteria bacterium]|nr:hypothetical protein [Candidatus Poribacteria bacterium]